MLAICIYYFFFFKQKTAYEMRISDWSSDVCSSDLDGIENRAMLANDLRLGPPLQALRALVPDCEPPFRIEHVDRITHRAVDKQVQLLSGSGPSEQTRHDLLILIAGATLPGGNPGGKHYDTTGQRQRGEEDERIELEGWV